MCPHRPGDRVGGGEALGHEMYAHIRVLRDDQVFGHALRRARLCLRQGGGKEGEQVGQSASRWDRGRGEQETALDGSCMHARAALSCSNVQQCFCLLPPIMACLQLTPLPAALSAACRRARAAATSAGGMVASTAGGTAGGTGQVCTAPNCSSSSIAP